MKLIKYMIHNYKNLDFFFWVYGIQVIVYINIFIFTKDIIYLLPFYITSLFSGIITTFAVIGDNMEVANDC